MNQLVSFHEKTLKVLIFKKTEAKSEKKTDEEINDKSKQINEQMKDEERSGSI